MFFTIPDHAHRLCIARRSPPADLGALAGDLSAFLVAAGTLHPALYPFCRYSRAYEIVPLYHDEPLLPVLEASRIDAGVRAPDDPSHEQRLFNARRGDGFADLSTSFVLDGEEPGVSPGLVVEVRLGRFVEGDGQRPDPKRLLAVFDALVRAFRPDFGFVETAGTAHPAPYRPAEPVVRWLTYLSRERPPAPHLLPPDATYPLDDLGTAYLATAELASAAEIPQQQAIEEIQRALASVLHPARAAEPPPPPPEPPRPAVVCSMPSFLQRAPEPRVDAPPLDLEQYASLTAELDAYAERGDEVMARYGVAGQRELAALHAAYQQRFAEDPETVTTFRALEAEYRDWFFRSRG